MPVHIGRASKKRSGPAVSKKKKGRGTRGTKGGVKKEGPNSRYDHIFTWKTSSVKGQTKKGDEGGKGTRGEFAERAEGLKNILIEGGRRE